MVILSGNTHTAGKAQILCMYLSSPPRCDDNISGQFIMYQCTYGGWNFGRRQLHEDSPKQSRCHRNYCQCNRVLSQTVAVVAAPETPTRPAPWPVFPYYTSQITLLDTELTARMFTRERTCGRLTIRVLKILQLNL